MESGLERFITDNPSVFEECTPGEGHTERFIARLEKAGPVTRGGGAKKKRLLPLKAVAGIAGLAASVVLLLMLADFKGKEAGGYDPQYAEAAAYFSAELNNTADQVRRLALNIDPDHRQEVLEDIETLSILPMEGIPAGHLDEDDRIGALYENYEARVNSLKMIENSLSMFTGDDR